jgi:hypothetical protein
VLPKIVAVACSFIVCQLSLCAEEAKVDARMRVIRVSSENVLRARCGAHTHPYACSRFVGEALTAKCRFEDGLWSLQSRARYLALVYVLKSEFLYHESLHLRDVERDVSAYVLGLEAQRFPSLETCDHTGKSAMAAFRSMLEGSAADSNAKRH